MNEPIRDVSPDEATDITQPEPAPGGSQSTVPPDKPQKKNLFDRITDAFKSDSSIEEKRIRKQKIMDVAKQQAAELDMEIARDESRLAAELRERDPVLKQQRKDAERLQKARLHEAKILCALYRRAQDDLRRATVVNVKDDDPDLGHFLAQLDNTHLMGTLFSTPPSRQKD